MSFQNSVGSYTFNNVTVSVGQFSSQIKEKSSVTYGPSIINIDGNYQTIVLSNNVKKEEVNKISFNRQLYSGYGNNILFCLFPMSHCADYNFINKLLKYTTMTQQQIENYSSVSITPQGNYITSPIICDRIFCQNGLYSEKSNKQFSKQNRNYLTQSSSGYPYQYNWNIQSGYTYVFDTKSKKISNSSSLSLMPFNFGGVRQIISNDRIVKQKYPKFKYVCGQDNVTLYGDSIQPNLSSDQQFCIKRVYSLDGWKLAHPQVSSDKNSDDFAINKFPFFFMLKLSKKSKGKAQLNFGIDTCKIRINVSQEKTMLSIGSGNIEIDLQGDSKNKTHLPFFMQHSSFKKSISMIVYPTYLGISVQSGVLQGGKNIDSRTGGSIFKPNGGFGKFGGILSPDKPQKIYQRNFPSFESWVTQYKSKISPQSLQSVQNIFAQPWDLPWGDKLNLQFDNAIGSFMFAPLFFSPYARFRMYFKGIKAGDYDNKTNLPNSKREDQFPQDSENCKPGAVWQYTYRSKAKQPGSKDGVKGVSHQYFGSLLFSCQYQYDQKNDKKRKNIIQKSKTFITNAKTAYRIPPKIFEEQQQNKAFYSKYSMDSYYFDFSINNTASQFLPRVPIQVLGVLILQRVTAIKSLLDNSNGKFVMSLQKGIQSHYEPIIPIIRSLGCNSLSSDWSQCITSVQVTHNQQGSTGVLVLDKYALMGQKNFPHQSIGGISIEINGGNPEIINKVIQSNVPRRSKILFTGYVSKMSTNDSSSQDTITVTLQGVQKKLTQLKLINPPFWDGDKLKDILSWLSFYAGVQVCYNDQQRKIFDQKKVYDQMSDDSKQWYDKNGQLQKLTQKDVPIVPVSTVFSRPAVNYKSGQDCFSVFKDVCFQKCNHRFVLQPDGKAYIFTQNNLAMPIPCEKRDTQHFHRASIDPQLMINYSIQPLMSNLHNFIITASLQGTQQGTKQTGIGDTFSGIKLNKKSQQIVYDSTNPWEIDIPWSKAIAYKHQGFLDQNMLSRQHQRNLMIAKNYWLNLKVTIPGNTNIWIYDRTNIFGIDYYVTQVSHNVDLQSKSFTTDVTLCSCIDPPES